MQARLDPYKAAPEMMKAMMALEARVHAAGLEKPLIELVKLRASQINGCAFCLHMHTRDARALGERQERLDVLGAWREAPCFTPRERAALAWTEAVTLVSETHVPDEAYEEARRIFDAEELVRLTLAVATINAWNRIAISFRSQPPIAAPA